MVLLCLGVTEAPGQIAFKREVAIGHGYNSRVAANSETFVRVGKAGFATTSSDGLVWQNRDAGTYESFNALYVLDDRFVAGGEAGTIFTSEDGVKWTPRLAGMSEVAGMKDGFLHVESSGYPVHLLRTQDGLTWTKVTERPTDISESLGYYAELGDITLHGWSRQVAGSDSESTQQVITQSPIFHPVFSNHPIGGSIAFGNDTWISNNGYFSMDGVAWEPMSVREQFESRPFSGVSIAGERFFFFDNHQFNEGGRELWTWKAGAEFELATRFEASVEPHAAYANGVYLFIESRSGAIYRSLDALTWNRHESVLSAENLGVAPNIPIATRKIVSYGDGFLLLLGGAGLFTSTDGLNWSAVAADFGETGFPTHLSFSGEVLVAHHSHRIWISTDTRQWEEVSGAPLSSVDAATYSGSHLIVIGTSWDTGGLRHMAARDDGGNWTRAVLATNERILDLVTGNGFTLAVFEDDIWSARDGVGPVITSTGPTDVEVFQNQLLTLSAQITSPLPTSVQWARGSLNLGGATQNPLQWTFDENTGTVNTSLVAKVDDGEHLTSLVYQLTVHPNVPPVISEEGISVHYRPNEAGGLDQEMRASVFGAALTYQWVLNGQGIVAESETLTVPINSYSLGNRYQLKVTNAAGSVSSENIVIAEPELTASEIDLRGPFPPFFMSVGATGAWGYQWRRNGVPIPGANHSSLSTVDSRPGHYEPIPSGFYDVLIFNHRETIRRGPFRYERHGDEPLPGTIPDYPWSPLQPAHLSNLSVRTEAGSGDAALVPGFVVNGKAITAPEKNAAMLIRAIGPSLEDHGVENAMSNPRLQVWDQDNNLIGQNFNWSDSTSDLAEAFETVGAFTLDSDSMDSALIHEISTTLGSTILTANAANTDATSGEVLVELYLLPKGNGSHLSNLSARASIKPERPLIAGFVLEGGGSQNLMIRAVGPGLADFGIDNHAEAPRLSLLDANGNVITEGQDGYPYIENVETAVGAFPLMPTSANDVVHVSLPAGIYTARVEDEVGGIVLIEIYLVPKHIYTPLVTPAEKK